MAYNVTSLQPLDMTDLLIPLSMIPCFMGNWLNWINAVDDPHDVVKPFKTPPRQAFYADL